MDIDPLDAEHPAWLLQSTYTFLRPLERAGGYGEIYLVRSRHGGELLALKIVRPDTEDHELARGMLDREGGLLGTLRHLNIVRLVKPCIDDSFALPHLLLEYVPGSNLEQFLKDHGDPITRLRLAFGIVSAVAYLHARGLQHNDLHPLNVVVDERAAWPLLIDFGLTLAIGEMDESLRKIGRPDWTHQDVCQGKPFSMITEKYQLSKLVAHVLDIGNGSSWLPDTLHELLAQLRRGHEDTTAAGLEEVLGDLLLRRLAGDKES